MTITIDLKNEIDLIDEKQISRNLKGKSIIDFPKNFVVFDIETTGLDSAFDEIIEIAAIKIINNKVESQFESLVKPKYEIDEYITKLTGITNDMVKSAPYINKVLPEFNNFIGNFILIGHNVNFDINFIYDSLVRNNKRPISNNFIDTLRLSRKLLSELSHHRLEDLAYYFEVDCSNNHRSIKDCEITLSVYEQLMNMAIKKYNSIDGFKFEFRRNHSSSMKASNIISTKTEFDEDNAFFDKYVAITGTLEKMLRKEAMQLIVDLGGHCEDNVTSKTNYLILGNNDYNPILRGKKSSKLIKAEKYKIEGNDIEIISENVFYDIIKDIIN